jgi:hypothetical protein
MYMFELRPNTAVAARRSAHDLDLARQRARWLFAFGGRRRCACACRLRAHETITRPPEMTERVHPYTLAVRMLS